MTETKFPPSEDYAGLIEWLRNKAESLSEIYPPEAEAADALDAVLAERDALKAERDALLACLAPVDDEALETIAARAIVKENVYKETQIPSKTLARAAIAAIRPHIEAAEREKCAKIVDERYWDANQSDGHIAGWNGAVKTIAAAIRSGK